MTAEGRVTVSSSATPDFEAWVRPHLPYLLRYAAVLDPRHDPHDLVQDALERAWLRWATYDEQRGSARTWLLAIVADRARRSRLRSRSFVLAELEVSLTDGPPEAGWTQRLDVRDAVRRLPHRQREAVVLHYYVGLTVTEAAATMGCAAGTVKSNLSDARANLALMLGASE